MFDYLISLSKAVICMLCLRMHPQNLQSAHLHDATFLYTHHACLLAAIPPAAALLPLRTISEISCLPCCLRLLQLCWLSDPEYERLCRKSRYLMVLLRTASIPPVNLDVMAFWGSTVLLACFFGCDVFIIFVMYLQTDGCGKHHSLCSCYVSRQALSACTFARLCCVTPTIWRLLALPHLDTHSKPARQKLWWHST